MILDEYLPFNIKIIIAIISGAVWIYFRTTQCYILLPRRSLLSVLMVSIWIYYNYYEPLFLPIGLAAMVIYYLITKPEPEVEPSDKIKMVDKDLVSTDINKDYHLL